VSRKNVLLVEEHLLRNLLREVLLLSLLADLLRPHHTILLLNTILLFLLNYSERIPCHLIYSNPSLSKSQDRLMSALSLTGDKSLWDNLLTCNPHNHWPDVYSELNPFKLLLLLLPSLLLSLLLLLLLLHHLL
jgi:hypothetical protein